MAEFYRCSIFTSDLSSTHKDLGHFFLMQVFLYLNFYVK